MTPIRFITVMALALFVGEASAQRRTELRDSYNAGPSQIHRRPILQNVKYAQERLGISRTGYEAENRKSIQEAYKQTKWRTNNERADQRIQEIRDFTSQYRSESANGSRLAQATRLNAQYNLEKLRPGYKIQAWLLYMEHKSGALDTLDWKKGFDFSGRDLEITRARAEALNGVVNRDLSLPDSPGASANGLGIATDFINAVPVYGAVASGILNGGAKLLSLATDGTIANSLLFFEDKNGMVYSMKASEAYALAQRDLGKMADMGARNDEYFMQLEVLGADPSNFSAVSEMFHILITSIDALKLQGEAAERSISQLKASIAKLDPNSPQFKETLAQVLEESGESLGAVTLKAVEKGFKQILAATERAQQDKFSLEAAYPEINNTLEFAAGSARLFSAVARNIPSLSRYANGASDLYRAISNLKDVDLPKFLSIVEGGLSKAIQQQTMKLLMSSINLMAAAFEIANIVMGLFGGNGPDPVLEMLKDMRDQIAGLDFKMQKNFSDVFSTLDIIIAQNRRIEKRIEDLVKDVGEIRLLTQNVNLLLVQQTAALLAEKQDGVDRCIAKLPKTLQRLWPTSGEWNKVDANLTQDIDDCLDFVLSTASSSVHRSTKTDASAPETTNLIRSQKLAYYCEALGRGGSTWNECDEIAEGKRPKNPKEFIKDVEESASFVALQQQTEDLAYTYANDIPALFKYLDFLICRSASSSKTIVRENLSKLLDRLNYMSLGEHLEQPECGDEPNPAPLASEIHFVLYAQSALMSLAQTSSDEITDDQISDLRSQLEYSSQLLEEYRMGFSGLSAKRLIYTPSHNIDYDLNIVAAIWKMSPYLKEISLAVGVENAYFPTLENLLIQTTENSSDTLMSRLLTGLDAVEGYDTPIILFDQHSKALKALINALEAFATHTILHSTLDDVNITGAKMGEIDLDRTIVESSRDNSARTNLETVMSWVEDQSYHLEVQGANEQGGLHKLKEMNEQSVDEFFKDSLYKKDQVVLYDFYKFALQNTQLNADLLQYHFHGFGDKNATFSFPVPVVPPTLQVQPYDTAAPIPPNHSLKPERPHTRKFLVFRRSDQTFQALLSANEDTLKRDLNTSDLNQQIVDMGGAGDFRMVVAERDAVSNERPGGLPAKQPTFKVKILGKAFPTTTTAFIRLALFDPDRKFPRSIPSQNKFNPNPIDTSGYADRAQGILNTIKPEVQLAKERGEVVQKFFDSFDAYKQELKDEKEPKSKPRLSDLASLFSKGLNPQSILQDTKPEREESRDVYMRRNANLQIDSPENLFLVVIYGSESDPALFSDVSTFSNGQRGGTHVVEIPKWLYVGNFFFQYWATEAERAQAFVINEINQQILTSWTDQKSTPELANQYRRARQLPPADRARIERDLKEKVKKRMNEMIQFDSLFSMASLKQWDPNLGDKIKKEEDPLRRDLHIAARRYYRTQQALSSWLTFLPMSDDDVQKINRAIEPLTLGSWAVDRFAIFDEVSVKDMSVSFLDLNEADFEKLGKIRPSSRSEIEVGIQTIRDFVYGPVLKAGGLISRNANLESYLQDIRSLNDIAIEQEENKRLVGNDSAVGESHEAWSSFTLGDDILSQQTGGRK